MTAEDKMSRAWLIIVFLAALAVIAGFGVALWIFWGIAGYVHA